MPYTNVWIDDDILDEYDDKDLIQEMDHRGYKCIKHGSVIAPLTISELYKDLIAYGWTESVRKNIEEFLYAEVRTP